MSEVIRRGGDVGPGGIVYGPLTGRDFFHREHSGRSTVALGAGVVWKRRFRVEVDRSRGRGSFLPRRIALGRNRGLWEVTVWAWVIRWGWKEGL